MKWPASLTFVRHAESEYNALAHKKNEIPEWSAFTKIFNKGFNAKNFEERVLEGDWPSPELRALTKIIHGRLRAVFGSYSDMETPLTEVGLHQASATGSHLSNECGHAVPDIVYVSPYLRTRQTYEGIASQWPPLKDVRVVEEERIREQEHGTSVLHHDWRVFSVMDPQSAALRKKVGPYYFRYPQGESVCDVRERARDFVAMLIREHREQSVMAITHHLTILSSRANLERWDHKTFEAVNEHEKPANCGMTIYKGDPKIGKSGKLLLEEYNRIHYTRDCPNKDGVF